MDKPVFVINDNSFKTHCIKEMLEKVNPPAMIVMSDTNDWDKLDPKTKATLDSFGVGNEPAKFYDSLTPGYLQPGVKGGVLPGSLRKYENVLMTAAQYNDIASLNRNANIRFISKEEYDRENGPQYQVYSIGMKEPVPFGVRSLEGMERDEKNEAFGITASSKSAMEYAALLAGHEMRYTETCVAKYCFSEEALSAYLNSPAFSRTINPVQTIENIREKEALYNREVKNRENGIVICDKGAKDKNLAFIFSFTSAKETVAEVRKSSQNLLLMMSTTAIFAGPKEAADRLLDECGGERKGWGVIIRDVDGEGLKHIRETLCDEFQISTGDRYKAKELCDSFMPSKEEHIKESKPIRDDYELS